jgi:hemin uptake protein HemP
MMDSSQEGGANQSAIPGRPPTNGEIRKYDARDLFGESREIEIIFNSQSYRLRITRQEKLILTK